jgi:hypothetical protein
MAVKTAVPDRTGSIEKEYWSLNTQIEFLFDRAVREESPRETEVHKATGSPR